MAKQSKKRKEKTTPTVTVATAIERALGESTRTERRIAQTLLSHYPLLGLETLTRVAEAAHTTAPTVLRFVNKLGYQGYADFQQALRSEIQPQLQSALSRHVTQTIDVESDHYWRQFAAAAAVNLERALSLLPERQFDAVVALLADVNRPVLCVGGRYSYAIANGFQSLLKDIRPRVDMLWNQTETWPSTLLDVGKRHIVVVFDFRRYQPDVCQFAEKAHERGATIILFTDEWMSDIARFASEVITSPVSMPSLYDSTVSCVIQAEAIAGATALKLKDTAKQRITELEKLRSRDPEEAPPGRPKRR